MEIDGVAVNVSQIVQPRGFDFDEEIDYLNKKQPQIVEMEYRLHQLLDFNKQLNNALQTNDETC